MAIEDDVLVIGGGIAGATAALAAARAAPEIDVRLLSHKQSTLRHATGLIDVLGYLPDGAKPDDFGAHDGPVTDPFDAIAGCPEGHPYERVGGDAVREALTLFDDVAGDAYAGGHTDANALVVTADGVVKPTARYPASVAAGLASDERSTLLVGFERLPSFDAPLAAARLRAAGVPFDVRGVTIRFPGRLRDDATVTRYADALDRDESVESIESGGGPTSAEADGGSPSVRAALAARVERCLDGERRVGFPAVLGEERAAAVRRDLADRLGADVFEVPGVPPSIPGMRLEDLLFDALEDAGVRVTTGVPVVDYEPAGGRGSPAADGSRIDRVLVDRGNRVVPYRAARYVLATGGLVGKGIRSDREAVREPIFDCHVAHPADRYDWFDRAAFGDHPFARFGVDVDRELRPLDADGEPEFGNLRAAGGVLAGADVAAEKSGAGISLTTGYVAGRRSAAEVVA